jgi:outer membrane protein assembly factor BamB
MSRSLLAAAAAIALSLTAVAQAENWPQFRGPNGNGTTPDRGFPLNWSAEQNIAWKTELPGPGNSSPIVWEDRVFLTVATEEGSKRSVLCLDRASGEALWHRTIEYEGDEPTHEMNPYCAATPVTDGEAVYAFHGSAGVVAYDLEGNRLWHRDLGRFEHIRGNASSPILFRDLVLILGSPGSNVALIALDQRTGQTVWKRELPDAEDPNAGREKKTWRGAWSTPVVIENRGRPELIVALPNRVRGFNPYTGRAYWKCEGLGPLAYASPIVDPENHRVVATSGFGGPAIGLRLPGAGASGDVTETHRLWRNTEKIQQRIGTGVVRGDHVYLCSAPGIAQCIEMETGERVWRSRLAEHRVWTSPTLVGDRLYITDDVGTTHVLRASSATNSLGDGETTRASPAFSEGQIFIRTYDHLYCIGTRRPNQ